MAATVALGLTAHSGDPRIGLLAFFLLACGAVYPCLFAAERIRDVLRLPPLLLFAVVLVILGAFAEITFFLTLLTSAGARAFVWLSALAGVASTSVALRGHDFRRTLARADAWLPFALTALGGISYAALLSLALPDFGAISTTTMTWFGLAVDNIIPHLLAVNVAAHAPPEPFIPGWQSSDRPPLQAGFDLLFGTLLPLGADGLARYQAISMLLQATIFGTLFTLCRSVGASSRRGLAIVLLAWLSGFFFANTAFVWPKLLAATFFAAAMAVFVVGSRPSRGRCVFIGVSASLGLLAHGGVIFSVPALAIAWLVRDGRNALRPLALTAAAMLVVAAPWTLYARVVDPPGDRLLKWHLAGQVAVTREPFVPTLVRAYTTVPLATLVQNRGDNLLTLVGLSTPYRPLETLPPLQRQFRILPSALGALAIPYLAALLFVRSRRPLLRAAAACAWIAFGANAFWLVAMYNPSSTVVILGSYFTVVLMYVAAGLIATQWLPLFALVVAAQAIVFGSAFLPTSDVTRALTRGRWCDVLVLIGAAAAAVALVFAARTEPVSPRAKTAS